MRIEIIGSIASGKTTLARALESPTLRAVYEDLSTNPYLDRAKENPDKFGILCQEAFLKDKTGQLGLAVTFSGTDVIADYSLVTERAYARHHLGENVLTIAANDEKIDRFHSYYGEADVYIYLKISAEDQLDRIKRRGRGFEQGLSAEYLNSLNKHIQTEVYDLIGRDCKVLQFDVAIIEMIDIASIIRLRMAKAA